MSSSATHSSSPVHQRARGIILRTRPLTETSLIVNWLTPDLGRVSTVAKGARRPKSPFRGKLDLFYEADFSFQPSRRSELHTLREVSLIETHPKLRTEIGYVRQASYAAALIEQTTERETSLPVIYELMRGFVAALPAQEPQAQNVFAFELKLLDELGLKPDFAETKLAPGTKMIADKLASSDWQALARLRLSDGQHRELQQFLHVFLVYHLEKIPAARDAALHF